MNIWHLVIFLGGILFVYLFCIINCYYYNDRYLFIKAFRGSKKQCRFFVPEFMRKDVYNENVGKITYIGFVSSIIVLSPLIILAPAIVFMYLTYNILSVDLFIWWFTFSSILSFSVLIISMIDSLLLFIYKLTTKRRRY